jgi:LDH2 family malate/lactate/ureidoglycolate dehydrogenase
VDQVTLTLDEVSSLAFRVLKGHGFSEPQAASIAETVMWAERDECPAHGLFRIPFYVGALKNRYIDPAAEPELSSLAPGILRVDAKFGFAPYALKLGIPQLIKTTRSQGVAVLCVNNAYHIAALWPEVEAIAEADLVGFAFTNALPAVAPAGGTMPLFGTNPMAFAWPRKEAPPFVFDQASSLVSRGEIQIHEREGNRLPEGWAIGPDGSPTTDPTVALEGALLPFGGHKGSAIALMVELLAGALVGDLFSHEVAARDPGTVAPCGGEFLIAVEPGRCTPTQDRSAQNDHAEQIFARVFDQPGARLPSERRFAARKRTSIEGVTFPAELIATLRSYSGKSD